MNCFNHPNTPAVAMCYSCYKVLCHECRSEVEGISSCKGACEDRVRKVVTLVNTNARVLGAISSGELLDVDHVIFKHHERSAAHWILIFSFVTAYLLYKFLASFSKPEIDLQYLWFATFSGAFLYWAVTSFRTWRALASNREKIISLYKPH